jgi:Glycosyltransferase family 87
MRNLKSYLSSRLPVFAAVVLTTLALSIGTYKFGNVTAAWRVFHLPALSPTFSDTITITYSIDCLLHGKDPYVVREYDPFARVYNYPPIWLDLRYFGITSRSTNLLGILFGSMAVAALLSLFRVKDKIAAITVLFSLLCRPLLTAFERGNNDLVIFSLLVFGFFLIERQGKKIRSIATVTLLVVLTILKIYPVAAVAVIARTRSKILTAIVAGIASIAALLLTAGHTLSLILANTPQETGNSYGAFPFFVAVSQSISHELAVKIMDHHAIASIGAMVIAGISVGLGWRYRDQLDGFLPRLDFTSARGSIAISCLAIFCFTFLRGSSFNYRLIFLMGALAYLVDNLNPDSRMRRLAACICLSIFLLTRTARPFLLIEFPDILIFAVACAWLGTTFIHAWFLADNNFAGFEEKTANTDLDINAQNPVKMA